MGFDAPWALPGLLAALIPLLLGLLRLPPERRRVPTLMIWRRLRERTPPFKEMRRPRLNAALILSAAAIAAGVAALAGPSLAGLSAEPRHAVLVFDTGPRMGTRHADGRTSFEHAREHAARLISGLAAVDRVHFVARQPGGLQHVEKGRDEAVGHLERLAAGVMPSDLGPPLERAREIAGRWPSAEIVVFSDRPVAGVRFSASGREQSDNAGIVALDAGPERVFVRIANAGPARRIALSVDGRRVELELPRGDGAWVLERAPGGGPARVEILESDDLPEDNAAGSSLLPGRGTLRVSYRGRAWNDLLHVLNLIPDIQVIDSVESPVDVAVTVGMDPGPQQAAALIAISPQVPEVPPFKIGPASAPPTDLVFEEDHPVIREILYHAEEVTAPERRPVEGGTPLISAGTVPICAIEEGPGRLTLVMAFDPFKAHPETGQAAWSGRPTFAVFFAALFEHIRKVLGGRHPLVLRAGRPLDLRAYPDLTLLEGDAGLADGFVTAWRPGPVRLQSALGPIDATFNLLDTETTMNAGTWAPLQGALFPEDRSRPERSAPLAGACTALCLVLAAAAMALERR